MSCGKQLTTVQDCRRFWPSIRVQGQTAFQELLIRVFGDNAFHMTGIPLRSIASLTCSLDHTWSLLYFDACPSCLETYGPCGFHGVPSRSTLTNSSTN